MRNDIQQSIAEAMDSDLADAVEPFTATREVVGEYDPVSGTQPNTTETWAARWIRDTWSAEEIDGQHILAADQKRIVLQNETTWTPEPGDIANDFTVISVMQDGALATYELQLRRT